MKFTLSLFFIIYCFSVFGQDKSVGYLLDRYQDVQTIDLNELSGLIDSLLKEKDIRSESFIRIYESQAIKTRSNSYMAKSLYFNAMFEYIINKGEKNEALNKALQYISNYNYKLDSREWAERQLELNLLLAANLLTNHEKEEAIELQYILIDVIDSLGILYPDFPFEKYHFRNYFNIANTFLFDNDEISSRYADSTIVWAKRYGDPDLMFSAYNMKYYTIYYKNDPQELNMIADSCITYALISDAIKNIGDAFLHKCNALVVSGDIDDGLNYCDRAIERFVLLNDSIYLSSQLHNVGNVFSKSGLNERALAYYEKALSYTSVDRPNQYFNSMETVAHALHDLGDYKKSSEYFAKFSRGFYNFYTEQLNKEFTEAEAKYQSELKEAEIVRQQLLIDKQQTTRNIIIGSSLVGIGLLGSLFFGFYQRMKRRRKESELALVFNEKRLEDLENLDKLKTDFFNNVSHELRTPLTLIIAPLENAVVRSQNIDLKKDLTIALDNSKKLLNISNEILDLSKIDASKLDLNLSVISLNAWLYRIFHSFDSLAKTRNITINENFDSESQLSIRTDEAKLDKILTNLVSNALKYSDDGGKVEMIIDYKKLASGRLKIIISDYGKGIHKVELARIFERFYQVPSRAHSTGTGIGLALVKELIELLDGEINVESEFGKGSSFIINVPVEIIEDSQIEFSVEDKYEEPNLLPLVLIQGQKPRILIVEDDRTMSNYLISLLEGDYHCDTAYDGRQALEKLEMHHYDLISSDVMMPEMDGFEFMAEVSQKETFSKTAFIMLTARTLEADKLRGLRLGIDDYITKPFSTAEYKARIYNLLKNKLSRSRILLSEEKELEFDKNLILRATKIVQDHLDNPKFKIEHLAKNLNYSSRQLQRLLQKLSGLSPVAFILEIRLQKAYQIIKDKKYTTINEVRYDVGIESASYFVKKFKERFGVTPGNLV